MKVNQVWNDWMLVNFDWTIIFKQTMPFNNKYMEDKIDVKS